jgi:uncharacterized protein (DUF1499 family)
MSVPAIGSHQHPDSSMSHQLAPALALCGFGLAVVSLIMLMLAGLGSRWGWWNFRFGFILLGWGAYGGGAAAAAGGAALALMGLSHERAVRAVGVLAVLGLLGGLTAFGIPWQWKRTAQRVPPIHDITTDVDNPPPFVALLPLRAGAPNPASYGGPGVAAQQRSAYPEIAPIVLNMPPDRAFALALDTARAMGWQMVAEAPAEGRIEATDTTLWFGFKDDIVIRVTPSVGGSRIDVRSVSRVGRSDVGTNARRIDAYVKRLMAAG